MSFLECAMFYATCCEIEIIVVVVIMNSVNKVLTRNSARRSPFHKVCLFWNFLSADDIVVYFKSLTEKIIRFDFSRF